MLFKNVTCILTDIEGTTSSISFVYEVLFPYFRKNIHDLKGMKSDTVNIIFDHLRDELEHRGLENVSNDHVINELLAWTDQDIKRTELKKLQGILWEEGYKKGIIKGHVYSDVKPSFEKWRKHDVQLGIFSSGSVQAQKLLFKHSEEGDLSSCIGSYFDTETGPKKDSDTYRKIREKLDIPAENILFLSDIPEELLSAQIAGFQTCQLIRPGTKIAWHTLVENFKEIIIES